MDLLQFWIIFGSLFAVAVAPKPPAPNIQLNPASTSITVAITPPNVGGIKGYRYQYSETGGKKILKEVGAVTEIVIDGLKPSTGYRVRILTKSSGGNGKWSGWQSTTTLADAPPPPPPPAEPDPIIPEAPQNVAADPQATSATITWEAPADNGAVITGYTLQYGPADGPASNTANVDGSATSNVLEGLMGNSQYRVNVVANSADGNGPAASADFQTLEEATPPPPVESIQATPTESTVVVTWSLPTTTSANGIDSIIVRFGEEGIPDEDLPENTYGADETTFTAEFLSPSTRYGVTVFTENAQGRSEAATASTETLAPAPTPEPVATEAPKPDNSLIPWAPENLRANDITASSARVTWDPPRDNGADITGYVISYGPINDPTANTFRLELEPTAYDMNDLKTDIQYSVYVTAYNRGGQSSPAEVEFWTGRGRTPPPPVENVQPYPTEDEIYFTWMIPRTSSLNNIETIRFGIGPFGTSLDYLPMINLEPETLTYTARNLAPGTRYTIAIFTQNSEGDSEPVQVTVQTEYAEAAPTLAPPPDKGYDGPVPPAPIELKATVLSPTTIRIDFVDPTMQGRTDIDDQRYYTVRYKAEDDISFQYMNIREIPYTLEYLQPEANYEIDVKLVIDRNTESPFTSPTTAFTGESIVQDVTAVQLTVTAPGRLKALIQWLPPQSTARPITGYAVEYTPGYYVTSRSVFTRQLVDGPRPSIVIEDLRGDETYHIRVAPRFGSGIGRFSDPPDAFLTLAVPVAGQPLFCDRVESEEQIRQRVAWMRGRPSLVGIPLPYCEDIYAMHECHGSICFCIPGTSPPGTKVCHNTIPFGDDPNANAPPCYTEYEAAREAIDLASKKGTPLVEVRLPYCTSDGYYQPKQCLGSMCYCATRTGKHTGKEVPIWDAHTLQC